MKALESVSSQGVQISDAERAELAQEEATIHNGLQTFVDVGNALARISTKRLYREGYATFADYCRDRWGLQRQRAYELMGAAVVVSNVSEISDITPQRESHAAPLAKLEPDEQRAAWAAAVDRSGGKPTGAIVAEVVKEMKQRTEQEEIDEWHTEGKAIYRGDTPEEAAHLAAFRTVLRAAHDLRLALKTVERQGYELADLFAVAQKSLPSEWRSAESVMRIIDAAAEVAKGGV